MLFFEGEGLQPAEIILHVVIRFHEHTVSGDSGQYQAQKSQYAKNFQSWILLFLS
jgi:hypothetical protein